MTPEHQQALQEAEYFFTLHEFANILKEYDPQQVKYDLEKLSKEFAELVK